MDSTLPNSSLHTKLRQMMSSKITREILENYLKCKYKSHLNFLGVKGIKSDYEKLLSESSPRFKQKATQKTLARCSERDIARDVALNRQLLQQGVPFILNGTAEDEALSLSFDGLKKIESPSKISNFHYVPILFSASEKIHGEEKTAACTLRISSCRDSRLAATRGTPYLWSTAQDDKNKVK